MERRGEKGRGGHGDRGAKRRSTLPEEGAKDLERACRRRGSERNPRSVTLETTTDFLRFIHVLARHLLPLAVKTLYAHLFTLSLSLLVHRSFHFLNRRPSLVSSPLVSLKEPISWETIQRGSRKRPSDDESDKLASTWCLLSRRERGEKSKMA